MIPVSKIDGTSSLESRPSLCPWCGGVVPERTYYGGEAKKFCSKPCRWKFRNQRHSLAVRDLNAREKAETQRDAYLTETRSANLPAVNVGWDKALMKNRHGPVDWRKNEERKGPQTGWLVDKPR